jgi:aspartyl-tRNA(Asn)/glutamyl-tRNA(Gln) amidotransferase subunit C
MLKRILLGMLSVAALLALTLTPAPAVAADPTPATLRLTSSFEYATAPAQFDVVNQVLDFANGAGTREHRHGGDAFVTVLEGQVARKSGDEVRSYAPRQTFTEPKDSLHSVKATGRTRVYASFLLSPGAPQTVNDPGYPAPATLNTAPIVQKTTVGTQPAEFTLTQLVYDFAPGAVLPLHKHGGSGLATVMEGELSFVSSAGTLQRGANTSFSNITAEHEVRNNGSSNATLLVVVLVPRGGEATVAREGPSCSGRAFPFGPDSRPCYYCGTMALTRDEVLHVAKLARVGVTDDDVTKFQHQLSDILDHFSALNEIDTTDVPPTTQSLPLENVMARDEPVASLPQADVLHNAPEQQDGQLRVRAVLEE